MMSNGYNVNIKVGEISNQIKIIITSKYSQREFDILADKDGIHIKGNDTLTMIPKAGNKISIDCLS